MTETGLFTVANGDFSTLVHVGAVDAPEFRAMVSTTETLARSARKAEASPPASTTATIQSASPTSCRCAAKSASPTTAAC